MNHLRAVVDQLRGVRVLVLGDVMVDEYLRGDVSRISPEAPVPVLEVRAHDSRLGGAANTAANIQTLGGLTALLGVVGDDGTAATLRGGLEHHGIRGHLVTDPSRPTSKKTRIVAQGQQIVRVDEERRHPVDAATTAALCRAIDEELVGVSAVVLSDYAKGVITPTIAQYAIRAARAAGIPVIVDPTQRDFAVYRGATVITPNLAELERAAPATTAHHDVAETAHALLPLLDGTALLVTRSADGMTLFRSGVAHFHVPAIAREVFDVTGAGDTVVATLALALGAHLPFEIATELASVAAAIAVSKRGTSTVSPAELHAAIDTQG
jgi:D-beta-D-heptose 7-phosphate kinase/D-beta-D-heptose 1-phosphate adenosyltransferase